MLSLNAPSISFSALSGVDEMAISVFPDETG